MENYNTQILTTVHEIHKAEADAERAKEKSITWALASRSHAKHAENLRDSLRDMLIADGVKSMPIGGLTIYISEVEGGLQVTDDIDAIPAEYVRVKREPDKKKIKDMLKSGQQVNWASLGEPKKTITIRSKPQ